MVTPEATYPSVLITLNLRLLLLVTATKASFINQLRELLLDELLNFGHSSLEAFFGGAGNVQVQRRAL